MDAFRNREKVATWATLEIRLPLPFSSSYLEVIGNASEFRGHRVQGYWNGSQALQDEGLYVGNDEGHSGNTHRASPNA